MADCAGRKPNKKKSKRGDQHSSSSGSSPETENGVFGDKEILKYLIAAQSDDVETLQQYLQHGMPVDTKCLMFLDTALHKACRTGSIKASSLLLAHGADIFTKTDDGQSALHIAVKNRQPDIIRLLLNHGAYPDVKADPNSMTPLMLAASMTNTVILRLLIEAGSHLDLQDRSGMCALHYCFSYYQERAEFIAHSVDCAKLLVEAGANIDLRDAFHKTPLTRAVEKMNNQAVQYFLSQNAEPDIHCLHYHSFERLSPLSFALLTRRRHMGNLLWYAGATCWDVRPTLESLQNLVVAADFSSFSFSQPRTLKEACRKSIRDQLRSCGAVSQKFKDGVNDLDIPTSLKDFILLKDHLNLV